MKTLKDLGMDEQQAVMELEYMRGFSKYLMEELGVQTYWNLCTNFARQIVTEEMRAAGIPESEIKEVCDAVDSSMVQGNEKALN